MKFCSVNRALLPVVLACTLLVCSSAFAVLGEDVSSVRSDSARIKAEIRVVPGPSYTVHQMTVPTGTAIKEFVSPAGLVFAVSWVGPYTPNLRQLLGQYFDQYLRAAQTFPRRSRHAVHIETGDLVFEAGGHMRFIVGRAYLRSKIPDGASADVIR
jgi:Protein of unknown function (DUF2844)